MSLKLRFADYNFKNGPWFAFLQPSHHTNQRANFENATTPEKHASGLWDQVGDDQRKCSLTLGDHRNMTNTGGAGFNSEVLREISNSYATL